MIPRTWDDPAWVHRWSRDDLANWVTPYIGNGRIGLRVAPGALCWERHDRPLEKSNGDAWGSLDADVPTALGRHVYDAGDQVFLPAWNLAWLEIDGERYAPSALPDGLDQRLDRRTGLVSVDHRFRLGGADVHLRVELSLPRTHPHGAWHRVRVSAPGHRIRLRLGVDTRWCRGGLEGRFDSIEPGLVVGDFLTRTDRVRVSTAFSWRTLDFAVRLVAADQRRAAVDLEASDHGEVMVAASVHSAFASPDTARAARDDVADLLDRGGDAIETANRALWSPYWHRALKPATGTPAWDRAAFNAQFHLLQSLAEDGVAPLGALGLSRPGWQGSQLWDADCWILRGILPLWPEFARGIVAYRRRTLVAAEAHARAHGFDGAWFGWMTDWQGRDITHRGYIQEIHLNAWIGLGAYDVWRVTRDDAFLRDIAEPLLSAIARFACSRADRDTLGAWHLRGVLPPDEQVHEDPALPQLVDDCALTNAGFAALLRAADEVQRHLGRAAPTRWREVADGLIQQRPAADGVVPEYSGYSGHRIKQASAILIWHPLQVAGAAREVLATVDYYRGKVISGPLMTGQIEATLMMRHGRRDDGLRHLFTDYLSHCRGSLDLPFETRWNDNSAMLTGVGGLLQALVHGHHGCDLDSFARAPRLLDADAPPATAPIAMTAGDRS